MRNKINKTFRVKIEKKEKFTGTETPTRPWVAPAPKWVRVDLVNWDLQTPNFPKWKEFEQEALVQTQLPRWISRTSNFPIQLPQRTLVPKPINPKLINSTTIQKFETQKKSSNFRSTCLRAELKSNLLNSIFSEHDSASSMETGGSDSPSRGFSRVDGKSQRSESAKESYSSSPNFGGRFCFTRRNSASFWLFWRMMARLYVAIGVTIAELETTARRPRRVGRKGKELERGGAWHVDDYRGGCTKQWCAGRGDSVD